ncbi:MAG: ATP-binding protein [Phycisphaeraceae bacterium]|nr:ATP-binding protein [Phycisphaeraceae bacterium]
MNRTIQAQVNPRLLGKANRLFTGSLPGRIIEILQNARRAGATRVTITNHNGQVTVVDNGTGIADFQGLLDLGGSNWPSNDALEASEDPAGVGLFCLAPRKLAVRSNGTRVVIEGDSWRGPAVELTEVPQPVQGTHLQFEDEPWNKDAVESLAVFTGMSVTVDGAACAREPFINGHHQHESALGCRIQIATYGDLSPWHRRATHAVGVGSTNVLINFHGQTVGFNYRPVDVSDLYYLIDLTGEPTGIRLMLPARTQVVENPAFEQLKQVLERLTYLYVQQHGSHRLPFEQYLRARELGIELPESEPVYQVGLLGEDACGVNPVEVTKPEQFNWPGAIASTPITTVTKPTKPTPTYWPLWGSLPNLSCRWISHAATTDMRGQSWRQFSKSR